MFGQYTSTGNPNGIHPQYFDSADSVCLRRTVRMLRGNRIIQGFIRMSMCRCDCLRAAGSMPNRHNDVYAKKNTLSRVACGILYLKVD